MSIFGKIMDVLNIFALVTGYVVLIAFFIFIMIIIIANIKEKITCKCYRKNEIKIPYNNYQREKLGNIIINKPAAFILADNLENKELNMIARHISIDYEVYAVLLQDVDDPDEYLIQRINIIDEANIPIKRFLFSIPNGLNLHRFVSVTEIEDGISVEKEYIYYTMYSKKDKKVPKG